MLACIGVKAQEKFNEYSWTDGSPVTLGETVSFQEDWTFVGTFENVVAANEWGSAIIATGDNPFGDFSNGIQFYLQNGSNHSGDPNLVLKIGTNDNVSKVIDSPGNSFKIEVKNYAGDYILVTVTTLDGTELGKDLKYSYGNRLSDFSTMSFAVGTGSVGSCYFERPVNKYTYNYTFTGKGFAEDGVTKKIVKYFHNAKEEGYLPITTKGYVTVTTTAVEGSTNEYNVSVVRDYPFTFSADPDAGATWYTMLIDRVGSNGINAIYNNDEGNTYCQNNLQVSAGYIWSFLPDEDYVGIKICNLLDGKYLKADGDVVKCNASFEEATSFLPEENPTTGEAGFNLVLASNPEHYVGDHKNGGNQELSLWTSGVNRADEGNHFIISEIAREDYMRFDLADNQLDEKYVGATYAPTALVAAQDAYNANKTMENLRTYVAAYAANTEEFATVEWSSDKYYRIISSADNSMLTTNDTKASAEGYYPGWIGGSDANRKVTRTTNIMDLGTIWEYTSDKLLKNANAQYYLGGDGKSITGIAGWTGAWVNEATEVATAWKIKKDDNYLDVEGEKDLKTSGSTNTTWKVQPVNNVQVYMGTSGWASLVLPFAATLPEGVSAYYGSSVDADVLNLTKWTAENAEGAVVLPAKMPVLLYTDEEALKGQPITLTITTTNETAPENKLKGNTTPSQNFSFVFDGSTGSAGTNITDAVGTWEGYYALLKDGAEFAQLTGSITTFPANRAYLEPMANVSNVRFSFGDLTGIEDVPAVQLNGKQEVYYDLNGRRVWAPKNGIFVTASGKKVFIK